MILYKIMDIAGIEAKFGSFRSMFPRQDAPIARAKTARSTPSTKSHSTRPARFVSHSEIFTMTKSDWNPIGIAVRTRKAPIRPQAVRIRRSDKARLPQESQDNKEGCATVRMHTMQDKGSVGVEAMQAFRVGVCSGTLHRIQGLTNSVATVVTRRPRVRLLCSRRLFLYWQNSARVLYGAFGMGRHVYALFMQYLSFCGRYEGMLLLNAAMILPKTNTASA
jgi:hypothetical protein